MIFINQLRQKIGVTQRSNETTTGGNAPKFYASMRLDVRRIGLVKVDGEAVANKTRVRLVKNKMAPPFKSVNSKSDTVEVSTNTRNCSPSRKPTES